MTFDQCAQLIIGDLDLADNGSEYEIYPFWVYFKGGFPVDTALLVCYLDKRTGSICTEK